MVLVVIHDILNVDALFRLAAIRHSTFLLKKPFPSTPKDTVLVRGNFLQKNLCLCEADGGKNFEHTDRLIARYILEVWWVLRRFPIGDCWITRKLVERLLFLKGAVARQRWFDAKNVEHGGESDTNSEDLVELTPQQRRSRLLYSREGLSQCYLSSPVGAPLNISLGLLDSGRIRSIDGWVEPFFNDFVIKNPWVE